MMYIDLHTHTNASDGSMSPRELVKFAHAQGLCAIAVTDHDCVDGISEAQTAATALDMEFVAGIELSAHFDTQMHILGYYIDPASPALRDSAKQLSQFRALRAQRMLERFNAEGIDITPDDLAAEELRKAGRVHFAAALARKGYTSSIDEAFKRYLTPGASTFIRKQKFSPREVIGIITQAGGIPILAHAMYMKKGFSEIEGIVTELKEYGLMGVECHYSGHTARQAAALCAICARHSLVVTGGSDFHGSNKPNVQLGLDGEGNRIPYELLSALKAHKQSHRNT